MALSPIEARGLLIPLLRETPDLGAVSDPASWSLIKSAAVADGVAQLVAFAARSHVCGDERVWCDKVLTTSWTRHERTLATLDYILGVMDDAEIRSIALKGPVLARRHYRPPFLRKPSFDLDVAIHESDLSRACEALHRAGYSNTSSLADALAFSHHLVMKHASRPPVELHFRLTHGARGIPSADFFPRAVPFRLPGGRETLVLSPADEILHLALHLAHARFDNLFHAYETLLMWRNAAPEVREEAVRLAAAHRFSGVLALVDLGFRTRWREALLGDGPPRAKTWLHGRIRPELYAKFERSTPPGTRHTVFSRFHAKWLEFQITDRPADALRFAASVAAHAWSQLGQGGWRPVQKKKQIDLD